MSFLKTLLILKMTVTPLLMKACVVAKVGLPIAVWQMSTHLSVGQEGVRMLFKSNLRNLEFN